MKPQGVCLRRSEWEVRPIDLATAYDLVRAFHYAKSGSNTATYTHGLFRKDNWMLCMGVAWWLPPTKSAAVATFGGDWRRVLSLSRLAIAPEVPTNGASFLIGESIRMIRQEGKWDCLVTYADDWRGHTGAIYKATNWEYMGKTNPETTWVARDGRLVSRKAGPKTRSREEMETLGHSPLGKFSKHKFRLIISRTMTPASNGETVTDSAGIRKNAYGSPAGVPNNH